MIWANLAAELTEITEELRRSNVQVRGRKRGVGSGVIWSSDGVIITNDHVVSRRGNTEVELADGRVLMATITARNSQRDLVALKVDATDLPAAQIGDSENLRVGELVLAVGNPLGLMGAVTTGIIHSVGTTEFSRRNWIQADIKLAPGNSGGPLANVQGQVIGINTMIVNGRGFAVPSNVVQQFLSNYPARPYLGVTLQPVLVAFNSRPGFGLLITEVVAGSPAEVAKLQVGDVLTGVRGIPFHKPNELFRILENSHVGDGLTLNFQRDHRQMVADVVLCSRVSSAEAA
ncbi:trypsin-like peptidase domain-containing protein [Phormidium sp. LEGE 05292]|uniref:S1C family serine protease n=1 Tax=[Phormidium] sp. LEGE 05292 TaxID=767427 RepID=UPI00187EDE09|nr:trypsin-like peptidase domain-containing protein [Phormidium sp. LEGE 05292]MBE9223871.1 trypsin-like peptidase domain-containing protein [Phormidium sp. LEGE 05292]